MKKAVFALLIIILIAPVYLSAQERDLGYNPNSVYPILDADIMYKKRVWRRMDLREKQNKPFFAYNNEITKIIIESVKNGLITPYRSDSLVNPMTKEQFEENMKLPDVDIGLTEEEKAMGFEEDSDWGSSSDWGDGGGEEADDNSAEFFYPNEVSILELAEDMVFDKKRSRLYYDIQSIRLVIPAERFETGLEKTVGVFKYRDLEALFRSMPDEAYWFNPQNNAEHKNLADAFVLRLFSARITKVSNPDDSYVVDVYNKSPRQGILASQWIEYQLMEKEHHLWEY